MSGRTDLGLFGPVPVHRPAEGQRSVGGTDVWLTPPDLLAKLGPFDLDPCYGEPRPWPTAATMLGPAEDGLRTPWPAGARVWLNAPYSDVGRWLAKLAGHGVGTALVFARTETRIFHEHVWERATALLFLRGRITFHRGDGTPGSGNAGGPSVLAAYGVDDAERLGASGIAGAFLWIRRPEEHVS